MPANLPPHYFEAEKRYREAATPEAKVRALEEMLTIMPKHKGTDKLRASIRKKIARAKDQSKQKKGVSRADSAYNIDKEGAGQVVLVGPPNSGKSSLLAALTNARPEVADYPHSTWKPSPGMVQYQNVQFQLVDTPPLSDERVDPWMADLLRRADILTVVADLKKDPFAQVQTSLSILEGLRVFPEGASLPRDLRKPPFIKKVFVLVNKVDSEEDEEDFRIFLELRETNLPCLPVSVRSGRNLDRYPERMYRLLGVIRVFTKAPGKAPDLRHPFVVPKDSTLEDLAGRIHKDFVKNLKFARVWGESVHDGQMVQKDHVLNEGDIVEIHA